MPLPQRLGARHRHDKSQARRIVSAFRWQEQHDSALIEAALTNGAVDGSWPADSWGVVFEVLFKTEEQWQAFRNCQPRARPWTRYRTPSTACSSTVAGAGERRGSRRPETAPAASAASLPEPETEPLLDLTGISPQDLVQAGMAGGPALIGHEPPAVRKTTPWQP
jgi:hypothetical protein